MANWLEQFVNALPHGQALGIEFVSSDSERGHATLRLPWREDLVGDPATGVLHGGVITALLDTLGACSVLARKVRMQATLDLRIDYLRPATPRVDLIGEAECYRVTRSVAFVRGSCHHGDPGRPVANLTATFVLKEPKS
ncbi:MAG TPA: PaaI family thioesterase [Polyangiales bacterium]